MDVLIIGAGMSGLNAAIQIIRTYGSRNFEIIEKSDHVGGTWWINSYPGCGCDVSRWHRGPSLYASEHVSILIICSFRYHLISFRILSS